MSDWREREKARLFKDICESAYWDSAEECLRWESNDAVIPESTFKDAGIAEPLMQSEARQREDDDFFEKYREEMRDHQHSFEDLAEMRNAFGEGTTVVNVLTGQRIRV